MTPLCGTSRCTRRIIPEPQVCIKYGPGRTRFIAPTRIIRFLVRPSTIQNGSENPASRYISSLVINALRASELKLRVSL